MRDVLCIYYSRTGNTKRVMETIAKEMDAELLALTDGVERSGLRGWLRSGMDAMKLSTKPLNPFELTFCPLKRNGSWKITGWSSSVPRCGPDGAAA